MITCDGTRYPEEGFNGSLCCDVMQPSSTEEWSVVSVSDSDFASRSKYRLDCF